jgi:hypothetical protein
MNSVEKRALGALITRRFDRLATALRGAEHDLREKLTAQAREGSKEARAEWQARLLALVEEAAAVGFEFTAEHYVLATESTGHAGGNRYHVTPKVRDARLATWVNDEVALVYPNVDLDLKRDELLEELFTADLSVAAAAILAKIPTVEDLARPTF